ncbi:M16 family metallopeptidase [Hyphomicrobium sp. DMF-1]|jgi:zinc protease|uniref:M16 family metallopeptidase n=1 Tax=Hyphomicrobium sp. DMF-1 TaxID=3019544 RepID=UPI0022EBF13A|nr:pitrilysin family protein [Hyphomicrobium sp. DMF-1]WBT37579.1 pitrilysin family protein [Hyphomicrobium sp. DMF-1]
MLQRSIVRVGRIDIALSLTVLVLALVLTFSRPAHAMKIEVVKSPGGIQAWLVEAHENPLLALKFSFEGGNSQDPEGKDGVANFVSAMLDEGAGDIQASDFQEQMESLAMRMRYEDSRDAFYGNFETLTQNRNESAKLLKLALTKPRFDQDAVERIRGQLLANLVYADRDPEKVAAKEWFAVAFAGHSYSRPSQGTEATVNAITRDDLEAYRKRIFARSNLKVVAVGDITPEQLGKLLDDVFGDLPEKASLAPVPLTKPAAGGKEKWISMDVPQSVAVFGLPAMPRKDPDFMAAFVLNQLIGGGGFASRLMEEVREKRGLAYSVYSYIQPFRHTSILTGGVATRADAIQQSLDVIRKELKHVADEGPTPTEFENAKKYLIGSYALRFDTNSKIASQLLGLLEDDFGPEYIDNRNKMIEAITLDDAKRVAKRLLDTDNLIVTIVGQPATATADKKG